MAGETLTTDAVVLGRRLPSDSFQSFTVYSPTRGVVTVLQRVPRRPSPTHLALDLFDEVALLLETSNQGQTWFVKEVRLLHRHTGIGQNYERLRLASAFAALVARNPGSDDGWPRIHRLLGMALAAFAESSRPDVVAFKSLYSFAREEGYPIRAQWLDRLPHDLNAIAVTWLRTPLAELPAKEAQADEARRLQPLLEDYLRAHTEILMD